MMDDRDCWQEDASEHYRELVTQLREMAGKCCLPNPQRELLILARHSERRADHLDRRTKREARGLTRVTLDPRSPHIQIMTHDLTDEEKLALAAELKRTIAQDRHPLSPRTQTLKAILAKLEPPARLTEPLPPPKHYAAVHSRAVTARLIRITQS